MHCDTHHSSAQGSGAEKRDGKHYPDSISIRARERRPRESHGSLGKINMLSGHICEMGRIKHTHIQRFIEGRVKHVDIFRGRDLALKTSHLVCIAFLDGNLCAIFQ